MRDVVLFSADNVLKKEKFRTGGKTHNLNDSQLKYHKPVYCFTSLLYSDGESTP